MSIARSQPQPEHTVTVREETYPAHSGPRAVHLFRPGKTGSLPPMIVLLHGGDFVSGGIEDVRPAATELSKRLHAIVATPAYTLADEKPFPEAAEDAYAALRWAHTSASRVAVVGEEAGGNLAAVAALMAKDRCGPPLAAQVLICPLFEPDSNMRSNPEAPFASRAKAAACHITGYRRYLPRLFDRLHPYAAPAQCSRLAGVAPTLIISTEGDPLCDEAEKFSAALIASGVTTQVSRVARNAEEPQRWSGVALDAIVNFLRPRLEHAHRVSSKNLLVER